MKVYTNESVEYECVKSKDFGSELYQDSKDLAIRCSSYLNILEAGDETR